jgi:hypothetical protein
MNRRLNDIEALRDKHIYRSDTERLPGDDERLERLNAIRETWVRALDVWTRDLR